ncbi:MAG: hypothetical protein CVV44_05285 [Spirochaetae bacterium HGW-Spirochaetae-1]|jgi:DNA-binding response OmpR family regulator|nr:MAG: hypothetical protein CVV44_05285 [Spirochaetae bacterium HGW-Spirochaetae-1]
MKAKILVVDDSELSLKQVDKYLKKTDYTIHLADHAQSAIERLKSNDYDIIITDKNMPGLYDNTDEGGMELLRYAQKNLPNTEVIMMTGFASIETAIEAMKLGAFDYLIKPFTQNELLDCIKRLLGYKAFLNPGTAINIYKNIHNEILKLMERLSINDDEDTHAILKSLDQKIDHFFKTQKDWEKVIIMQREALANIIPLAEQLKENLPNDKDVQDLAAKIIREADNRI